MRMPETRHLLNMLEPYHDKDWMTTIIKLSKALKTYETEKENEKYFNKLYEILKGCRHCWITTKRSVRTRIASELVGRLEGHFIALDGEDIGRGADPYIELSTIIAMTQPDVITARMDRYDQLKAVKQASEDSYEKGYVKKIPIDFNGLCDTFHPLQGLADVMTTVEKSEELEISPSVVYIGDGNNVSNSLIIACLKYGIPITVATPEKYKPFRQKTFEENPDLLEQLKIILNDDNYTLLNSPEEAIIYGKKKGELILIYTDTYISMGEEKDTNKINDFTGFRLTEDLYRRTGIPKRYTMTMHCQPIHEEEIESSLARGTTDYPSLLIPQAMNRIFTHHAAIIDAMGRTPQEFL